RPEHAHPHDRVALGPCGGAAAHRRRVRWQGEPQGRPPLPRRFPDPLRIHGSSSTVSAPEAPTGSGSPSLINTLMPRRPNRGAPREYHRPFLPTTPTRPRAFVPTITGPEAHDRHREIRACAPPPTCRPPPPIEPDGPRRESRTIPPAIAAWGRHAGVTRSRSSPRVGGRGLVPRARRRRARGSPARRPRWALRRRRRSCDA